MLGLHPTLGLPWIDVDLNERIFTKVYGFTGTRTGMTQRQRYEVFRILGQARQDDSIRVRHGDCIGADADFDELCVDYQIHRTAHPPLNPKLRAFCECEVILEPRDYMVRNHAIVDGSALLLACPSTHREIIKSGTWATIRYAGRLNVPTVIVFPDGSTDVG